jgi:hypothetical protein
MREEGTEKTNKVFCSSFWVVMVEGSEEKREQCMWSFSSEPCAHS